MSNKYSAILYDLDGTLTDSVPLIMQCFHLAYNDVLGEVTRTDEDLMSYIGKPLMTIFADKHDQETAQKLFDSYLRFNEKMLQEDKLPLFDGIMDSLIRLHNAGVRQGIVTSKRRVSLMTTLKVKKMEYLFEQITVCEDTDEHKPSGAPLVYSAQQMGIEDMSSILYVGDAVVDYQSALDAGTDFVLVDWTKMNREEFRRFGTPKVIKSLDELL